MVIRKFKGNIRKFFALFSQEKAANRKISSQLKNFDLKLVRFLSVNEPIENIQVDEFFSFFFQF